MATSWTLPDLTEVPRSTLVTYAITSIPLLLIVHSFFPIFRSKEQKQLRELTVPMWMFLEGAFGSDVLLATGWMKWLG